MNSKIVVIGGSAGSYAPLLEILESLQVPFDGPIILVLHVHRSSLAGLAASLQAQTGRLAKVVEDKDPIEERQIYIAPPDYHVLIEKSRKFALSQDDPVSYSRPSIDVTFQSCSEVFKAQTVAVVLSGANEDGAAGAKAVAAAGGLVYTQSPKSAEFPLMPLAASRAAPQARSLPARQIAEQISGLNSHSSLG